MVDRMMAVVILVFGVFLNSCLLVETAQNNKHRREVQIPAMENELHDLEQDNEQLRLKMVALSNELKTRQMTLRELEAELGGLRQEIDKLNTKTKAQAQRKMQINAHIRRYQSEIDKLKRRETTPDPGKQKQLEQLQEEIRFHLERGLR